MLELRRYPDVAYAPGLGCALTLASLNETCLLSEINDEPLNSDGSPKPLV